MKKSLLTIAVLAASITGFSQSVTTVTDVTNCTVFRNFNSSDEQFSSPSIYSGDDDVAFYWNAGQGAEIESSGLTIRRGTLISPQYLNSQNGQVTIGFRFEAPVGTEYRVRVINPLSSELGILATTANGPVYTALPSTSGNLCIRLDDADLIANQPVRFEFTFRAVAPGNVVFDDLALSVVGGPLPVSFQGFTSRAESNGATKLLWDVSQEINVRGYEVETSTDGVNFMSAGFVNAAGKSSYDFDFTQLIKSTRFFRIRSVDFDNSSKVSGIIKVKGKELATSTIQLYPVPATSHVFVQHEKVATKANITLISPDGKVIKQVRPMSNTLQTQVNIAELKAGVYIVRYDDGEGKVQSVKLVKN